MTTMLTRHITFIDDFWSKIMRKVLESFSSAIACCITYYLPIATMNIVIRACPDARALTS